VGDGEVRATVGAKAQQHPSIRVIGRLSENEVWRAYAATDFFVGTSRIESWGLVINEAMAANLPVVVTNAFGCVDDLVHHGNTGLIVPVDDAEALALALDRLLSDESLRKAMATNVRRLISGWTIEQQASNIIQIWQRSLSTTGGRLAR
jgi:glycosyltransferase involved in cell wall biosynthesis